MEAEVWKDIPGYEGAYQVSSLGRVRSLDREVRTKTGVVRRMRGRVLRPAKYGRQRTHVAVVLGKGNHYPVHHLVMLAFVGPRPVGAVICHTNGDPTDNRVSNLRYDSVSENAIDVYRNGGALNKLTVEDVHDIRKRLGEGETVASLARAYGVSHPSMSNVKHGKSFGWLQ